MTSQTGNPQNQERPPIGFYMLMVTVGMCVAAVIIYLIATYFAK